MLEKIKSNFLLFDYEIIFTIFKYVISVFNITIFFIYNEFYLPNVQLKTHLIVVYFIKI